MVATELSVLLLTEDGAGHAHEVMEAIAKRMLLLVDATSRTHLISFVPRGKEAREVMSGNKWQGIETGDIGLRSRIVRFGRTIAAQLLERAPQGFVFFHFDGDHCWRDRHLAKEEKIAKLTNFLKSRVAPAVDHALREQCRAGRELDVEACVKAALLRLRRLTPFHSIEAWLFQNTVEAERLCRSACGKHLDLIRGWATDRGALDELEGAEQPKNQLPCIATRDHVALAKNGYPAAEVQTAGKSYAAAVDNLRRCRDLRDALARTRA